MKTNKTAEFLRQEYSWSKVQFDLDDVQPLSGGVRVRLPHWTMSQMFIRRVTAGGRETKYKLPLGWDEKKQLCRLCIQHDFLTIQPEERMGLPDEARPRITLTNSQHQSHTISKWMGVSDGRFDAIYQALRALGERTAGQRPVAERFNSWQKGLFVAGLGVGLLLVVALGYRLGQWLVAAWWPERFGLLFGMHLLMMAALLVATVVLARLESHLMRWDRTFTNPFMLVVLNFLFFLAVVGATGLVEAALSAWRVGIPLTTGDERALYGTLGYSAILSALLALMVASLIGAPVVRLVDERF